MKEHSNYDINCAMPPDSCLVQLKYELRSNIWQNEGGGRDPEMKREPSKTWKYATKSVHSTSPRIYRLSAKSFNAVSAFVLHISR